MKKLLFLLPVIFMTACSSGFVLTNSGTYNNVDMKSYKTFTIVQPDPRLLPPNFLPSDYANIALTVIDEMTARGYKIDRDNPDMQIYIGVSTGTDVHTKEVIPHDLYGYGNYVRWYGPRLNNIRWYYDDAYMIDDIYKKIILTVDMVDAAKQIHIFSASVDDEIKSGYDAKQDLRNIQTLKEVVAVLFSKFPVPNPNSSVKKKK